MSKQYSMIETLETRQMYAAHVGVKVDADATATADTTSSDTTIAADKALVKADRQKFNADRKKFNAMLVEDAKAYRDAVKALAQQLKPLQHKYDVHIKAFATASDANDESKLTVTGNYANLFATDRAAIKNAATPQDKAAAQAKFDSDKAAFSDAISSAKTHVNALRSVVKHDRDAMSTLISSDPKVSAAVAQYLSDVKDRATALQADTAKLQADMKQLKLDLAAHADDDTSVTT